VCVVFGGAAAVEEKTKGGGPSLGEHEVCQRKQLQTKNK
jgi:hypothetical protein